MVSSELQFMKVCEKLVTLLLVSKRPEGMVFQACACTETAVVRRYIDEINEQTSGQCCQTGAIAEGLEHIGVFRASGKHGRRQVRQTGAVVEAFVK